MKNLQRAFIDPSSIYKIPEDVLLDKTLSREQQIHILRRWAYDIREEQVALEENMQGNYDENMLKLIIDALLTLDAVIDLEHTPPTKQGG